MDRVIRAVSQKLYLLSGIAVIAMALIMTLDVISRYLLKTSLMDTNEISSMLLGSVTSLALASVTREEQHIQFSLLTEMVSSRARRCMKAAALMISAALFSLLTWQTTVRAISALRSGEFAGSLQIPTWPSKSLFALGCLLSALVLLMQVISFFTARSPSATKREEVDFGGEE